MPIEEKKRVVLELAIMNLCNKLSDPSRCYFIDRYVQLSP